MTKLSYMGLINFRAAVIDCHPIYRNLDAREELLCDACSALERFTFDTICGIQSQGFILASLLSYKLRKPLVLIEKKQGEPKLPSYSIHIKDYTKNYKGFYLRKSALPPNSNCLIVDDWIETGSQIQCAMQLIREAGSKTSGVLAIHADSNAVSKQLLSEGRLISLDDPESYT